MATRTQVTYGLTSLSASLFIFVFIHVDNTEQYGLSTHHFIFHILLKDSGEKVLNKYLLDSCGNVLATSSYSSKWPRQLAPKSFLAHHHYIAPPPYPPGDSPPSNLPLDPPSRLSVLPPQPPGPRSALFHTLPISLSAGPSTFLFRPQAQPIQHLLRQSRLVLDLARLPRVPLSAPLHGPASSAGINAPETAGYATVGVRHGVVGRCDAVGVRARVDRSWVQAYRRGVRGVAGAGGTWGQIGQIGCRPGAGRCADGGGV